ncbi:MAG: 50S ribosomal protein L4 [Candidatus Aenigmatarchaeota archaeon]
MKAKVFDLSGTVVRNIELPKVFDTDYKPSVIARAVLSTLSKLRQPYGSDKMAGKRSSAHYHAARHYRYSMMNKELARLPRLHGNVGYMSMRVRNAPQAVKGRKAHPPKVEKIWSEEINAKERILAIKSALAACTDMTLVISRGHRVKTNPTIVTDDFENLDKTKNVFDVLEKIGMKEEFKRCSRRKVRAGKGKLRGRKYRTKTGPLVVVSKMCPLLKSALNIPGVDTSTAGNLNALLLAPGCQAGRALVITESALQELEKKW